jgi:hypothetical protein
MAFVGEISHGLTDDEDVLTQVRLFYKSCPAEAFSPFVLQDPIAVLDQHDQGLNRLGVSGTGSFPAAESSSGAASKNNRIHINA